MKIDPNVFKINPADETEKLILFIQDEVRKVYRRRGVIVGIRGGVDSAVVASSAVRDVGKKKNGH